MAPLKFTVFVTIIVTTNVFSEAHVHIERSAENKLHSKVASDEEKNDKGAYEILDLLLHRSKRDTCGVPNPKCTTSCLYKNGCFCHQNIKGSHYYYIHPCRENSKICIEDEHELFDYTKISPQHSATLSANPSCKKIRQGVTEKEKHQILDIHNRYRAKVARGEEYRSPQRGVSQPRGSNIKELIWNDELAYIAQKWAEQCNFQHEGKSTWRSPCSRPYYTSGQNLYKIVKSWGDTGNHWPAAIKAWYDEVADSPASLVNKYAIGITSKMIGHYTQLVWAETYEIGCGAVYYKGGGTYAQGSTTLYVCNYGPAGNMIGGQMYKIGAAATACGGCGKSTKYPDLCSQ